MQPSGDYNALFIQSVLQRDWLLAFIVLAVCATGIYGLLISRMGSKAQAVMWLLVTGGFYATLALAYLTIS
jgi:hypothetical protein